MNRGSVQFRSLNRSFELLQKFLCCLLVGWFSSSEGWFSSSGDAIARAFDLCCNFEYFYTLSENNTYQYLGSVVKCTAIRFLYFLFYTERESWFKCTSSNVLF